MNQHYPILDDDKKHRTMIRSASEKSNLTASIENK